MPGRTTSGHGSGRLPVVAGFIIAVVLYSLLPGRFLQDKTGAALWASLLDRLVPEDESTFGILVTPVENLAATGLPLDDFTTAIGLRTRDFQGFSFYVPALRIVAAGRKLPITPLSDGQRVVAARALFLQDRLRRRSLARAGGSRLPRGLALRVTGAGQEGSETSLSQGHGLAAVRAGFL